MSEPPAPRNADILLVSDVDDTVKITHVTNPARAAVRGLWRNAVFSGMATLYRELGAPLVFVSASPTLLAYRLRESLIENAGFPEARFVLRDWGLETDTGLFKRKRLRELAEQTEARLLLIGDDTEKDPEIFLELAADLPPQRIAAMYIRRNLHRPLPEGVTAFLTAFDLAERECEAGRLSIEALLRIGEATLAGAGAGGRRLFPPFYHSSSGVDSAAPPGPDQSDARVIAMRARMRVASETIFAQRRASEQA